MTIPRWVLTCLSPLAIIAALAVHSPAQVAGEIPTLIPFEIDDQFGKTHRDADLRKGAVLVFWADRKGRDYVGAWYKAVRDTLESRDGLGDLALVEVAHLKGVPFFVKGKVKKSFTRDEKRPVLLDWNGRFSKSYEPEKDRCNMMLFDRNGALAMKSSGAEVTSEGLGDLLRGIEAVRQYPPDPNPTR